MPTGASNVTANYGLSQWAAADGVCREDFNSDHAAIDAALTALAATSHRIVTGTYTATDSYGSANRNSITLGFRPKAVLVAGPLSYGLFTANGAWTTYASTSGCKFSPGTSYSLNHSITSTGLSWYVTPHYDSDKGECVQLNSNNFEYVYVAIG